MITLSLIGIGTGNPDHLTLQAVKELNAADLILIPLKGDTKAELADVRREICQRVITNPNVRIVEFDLPVRDAQTPSYLDGVNTWHDAIASVWAKALDEHAQGAEKVALLVWGDPSLYDSTLRITDRLRENGRDIKLTVIPGITSLQALTAAHKIPLNALGEPVHITTGRNLKANGWPEDANTVAVMLDGGHAFETIAPTGVEVFWGAYLGMPDQRCIAGPLSDVSDHIRQTRAEAREKHGWIMDTYLLRRRGGVKMQDRGDAS